MIESCSDVERVEARIAMGVRFRGEAFYSTATYRVLVEELRRLKIKELWGASP